MTTQGVTPKWLTSRQAAVYTGFSVDYIRDAANAGRLKGRRSTPTPKGQWRFLAEDLDIFVRSAALGPRQSRRTAS